MKTIRFKKRMLSAVVAVGVTTSLLGMPAFADIKPVNSIRVNQHGYLPTQPKMAVYVGPAGAAWKLKDANGITVDSGVTTPFGMDAASGDSVSHIDFSSVTTPGDHYVLEIAGQTSYPFKISEYTYTFMKEDAAMYFYHQRLGQAVEAKYVGQEFAREAGHLMDDNLMCDDDLPSDWDPSSACSYSLDVRGGHADAGDYGAYVVNGGYYTWMLQHVFEANPSAYMDGSLYIPESGNGIPDILDEARYELDFIARMQVPQNKAPYPGMIHHKKSWQNWGPFPLVPADDDGIYWGNPQSKRTIKPVSTAATLNGAAVMAQAARLWQNYPQAEGFDGSSRPYSETLIERAEIAWKAAKENPVLLASADARKGSGPYNDSNVSDEFYWAAVELYITTGKNEYKEFLLSSPHFANYVPFDWAETANAGHYSLLLNKNQIDLSVSDLNKLQANLLASSDGLLNNIASEGYLTPLKPKNGSPVGGSCSASQTYPWGSIGSFTLAAAHQLGIAHRLSGSEKYLDGVTVTMDHVLGVNALDRAYMTGYGENPTKEPHHRFWLKSKATPVTAVAEAVAVPYPAAIAGGPQNDLVEDGTSGPETDGTPCETPAKSFADHWNNYSSNEITVNWNANLVAVLAYIEEALPAPADVIAPSAPASVQAIATSGSSVEVSWLPAADNGQVKKYEVLMNPAGKGYALYGSTMFDKAAFVPLTPGEEYCFKVVAIDYAGQSSAASDEVCTTTPAATSWEIYYQPDNTALSNYVGTGATNQPEDPKTILGNGWYHYEFHQAPPYQFHFAMPNWGSPDRFSPDGGTSSWSISAADFSADKVIWLTKDKQFHTTAPELTPISGSCEPDCPNVVPTAVAQTISLEVNETAQIHLVGADSDGSVVSYDIASFAAHGSVSLAGNIATYVPDMGNSSVDSFSFTVTDNEGAVSAPALISINFVAPCTVACPPEAENLNALTDMDTPVQITLLASDENGTVESFELTSAPMSGSAAISGDTLNYVPAFGFSGTDSFSYVAIDNDGVTSAPAIISVTVKDPNVNLPPVACFTTQINKADLAVSANASCSTDDNSTTLIYEWDFDDGNTSTSQIVLHNYSQAQTYTISLTVTDEQGLSDMTTLLVDLSPDNGSDLSCDIGSVDTWTGGVVMNNIVVTNNGDTVANDWQATISTDTEVAVINSWNADVSSTADAIIASGNPLHPGQSVTFGFQGSYSGELAHGACSTNGQQPVNRAPVARFSVSAEELTVMVDASASTDADGDILSYSWNFGEFVADELQGAALASYTYLAEDTYLITLTVSDGKVSDSTSTLVTVRKKEGNLAPMAAFTIAVDGLKVTVDGSGSTDPDGDALSYQWNFGDNETAEGIVAEHRYTTAGTYSISLTVSDGRGGMDQISQSVDVINDHSGDSQCEFVVVDQWQGGLNGKIVITNLGTQAIEGWQVDWSFTDGSAVTNSWNAEVVTGSTNTATPLSWNSVIAAGASVEFGMTVNAVSSAAAEPVLSGTVCP